MKNKKGFTLIELIVVIAILGILALILIPAFNGYIEDTKTRVASSYAKNVEIAFRASNVKLSASGKSEVNVIYNGDPLSESDVIKEMNKLIGDLKGKYGMYYTEGKDPAFFVNIVYDNTTYEFDCLSGTPVLINKRP